MKRGNANGAGQHLAHDFAYRWVAPGRNPVVTVTFPFEARQLEECLGNPRKHYPDRQAKNLFLGFAPEERGQNYHTGDHYHVENGRAQGGHKKMAARVGHANQHRRQTHQQHVRKHQTQQLEH